MENKEAAAAAAPAVPEKESQAASTCFKRTVAEDAGLMELAKDQYRQFKEAQGRDHWECIKNKVSSMFADPIFGGFKPDSTTNTPPSVESQ
ncbi:hypothetical protein CFC21_063001 [Triticum aestivum]|uniref:Uncharacterized protein n=4 Tax=Triticinae TaxID=1648030 RepID=A0A9R1KIQ5_WHEAT|nr:uncharacterized protein LOC120962599 [Aegilops tauschii subsp. strangulata]KAF7055477.1 hypothetical protein CFC21_063000 [Triticum aestivum]KAF7055478.1 hypothetical protein CFC21_063001 [Triticum aestivum]